MNRLVLTLIPITTLLFASRVQASTLLLSDDFNDENGGIGELNYTNFNNWEVTDGSIDLIGTSSGTPLFDFFPGNGLYLDLDGALLNAGKLESKSSFSFNPGDVIDLSFDILGQNLLIGGLNNEVTVSLESLINETFTLADTGTITRQIQVTSPTNSNLIFDHAGGDNGGLILDNVRLSVHRQTKTTPEPISLVTIFSISSFCIYKKHGRKSS